MAVNDGSLADEALPLELRRELSLAARAQRLLVGCGYDGTLAPLVADPDTAHPVPESVSALRSLAALHDTDVVVVSGRALRDLATLSRLPDEVRLIGSHGSEFDPGVVRTVDGDATDKGAALDALRQETGATTTVFIGDGPADEDAFVRLSAADLGIKVGHGATEAAYRVADSNQVAVLLAFLLRQRRDWLHGGQEPPIERLSMLANGRSVALVTPDARLSWMCHPEPDSAAVFGHLLGGEQAGHFSVAPERGGLPLGQRYLPGTMTIETRWSGLTVTDYLCGSSPAHRTYLVRVISGDRPASLVFAPRPDFGQVPVKLVDEPCGLRVGGTAEPIALRAPGVRWERTSDGIHDTARAIVHPAPNRPVVLELRCGSVDLRPSRHPEQVRRSRAGDYWSSWLAQLRLPPVETGLVERSALVLRGLCHARTGGIMAAATTSLPEQIGGVRNWDYRYCWIRDGALTARALLSLGSLAEAESFLAWLHDVLATLPGPERLRPLYTLDGRPVGAEAVIETLPGYAGSRPVRVGNLAGQQVQLDVFGPVVELIADVARARDRLTQHDWDVVRAMTGAVARRWREPDHGIWEEQIRPRHHVYSKVMCWVAIDRALALARDFGRVAEPSWERLREEIAGEAIQHGWNADRGAFTTAYDGQDLDAATLHIGLSGMIDPNDERFTATVTATEAELRSGPVVYRYRRDDGLPGDEGGFLICAAWLVEAYLLAGRRAEADELFKHLVNMAGHTGLLPEEYDPVAERSLGNHPQAYSHVGLIRCAQLLSG